MNRLAVDVLGLMAYLPLLLLGSIFWRDRK